MPDPSWIDYYPESNQSMYRTIYLNSSKEVGQSITGDGRTLDTVKFFLLGMQTPSGNMYAKLYTETHDVAFGTDSLPGDLLATSDPVDVTIIGNGIYVLTSFHFSTPYTLLNGVKYVITCRYQGPDGVDVGLDLTPCTHPGNECYLNTSDVWDHEDYFDVIFYAISDEGGSTLVKKIIAQCG